MNKQILAFALQNAIKYKGKANVNAVIGIAFSHLKTLKKLIIIKEVKDIVKQVNSWSPKKQIQELHWQSILDITKLWRIEWILRRAMLIILFMALVAIVSNVVGNFALSDEGNLRTTLRFYVPGILVFFEVV